MATQMPVVFVLGAPGAGKGTLSTLLTEEFPVQHISVGDLLRTIRNNSTHPKASVVTPALNKQQLLDAKTLIPILVDELDRPRLPGQMRKGILVDGFPRNLAQQQEFEKVFGEPALVMFYDCPRETAKQRYLSRRIKGRESDDDSMFEKRYEEYVRENAGIIRGYKERGILLEFNTGMQMEQTWKDLCEVLGKEKKWIDIVHNHK